MTRAEHLFDEVGQPIVVATHPRSGTHLAIDLLRKQFPECQGWVWYGETLHHLYLDLDHLDDYTSPSITLEKAASLLRRAERPIVKTHSLPDLKRFSGAERRFAEHVLDRAQILYVVRDGRGVMCSAHLWMQEYDASARCPLPVFMRQETNGMSRARAWAEHIQVWTALPNVEVVHFEDILSSPEEVISKLGRWLGLEPQFIRPCLPKKVQKGGRWADYWRRLTRQHESTAIPGRYNGKEPKSWHEAFSEQDLAFFHREAGHMLVEMGYEKDDQWTRAHHVQ